MPYASAEERAAYQAAYQLDRTRSPAIYRMVLRVFADPENTAEAARLERVLTAELAWREGKGLSLPPWPTVREEQILKGR